MILVAVGARAETKLALAAGVAPGFRRPESEPPHENQCSEYLCRR